MSVVVWQPENLQTGHRFFAFKTFQFGNESFGPLDVWVIQIKTPKPFIEVAFQAFDASMAGLVRRATISDKLTVAAIAHVRFSRAVPQVPAGWRGDRERALAGVRELPGTVMAVV